GAVIEADEYDRSFLKLSPDIAVLTSMDPDHPDIYGTEKDMQEAYIQYTRNIKPNGTLVAREGVQRAADLQGDNQLWYSLQSFTASAYATNIRMQQGGYQFDVVQQNWSIEHVTLPIGGMHNIE